MPIYSSDQVVKSGLPLGGIGAGKVEIFPTGVLDNFSFLNNLHRPIRSSESGDLKGLAGFHFAIFYKDKNKKGAKLLQTQPVSDYPLVQKITMDGAFPFARLDYQDEEIPVEVDCEAFSPLIPQDERRSGTPAAFFTFRIFNPSKRPITVALMACARNLVGEWGVGRFNQLTESKSCVHISSFNKKTRKEDPLAGEMCLGLIKKPSLECSYVNQWNMQTKPFVFAAESVSLAGAWDTFSQDGVLSGSNMEQVTLSESVQLGSALSAKAVVKPRSSVTVTFFLGWYFSGYAEGRMYEAWFKDVEEVAGFCAEEFDALAKDTKSWCKGLGSLSLDPWLKDALVNNLYPFVSSTLWTKKDKFGFFEAPEVCPLLGTLDVRFYGSVPLALFFPKLEMREMIQFAEAQRAQGYIPHDLGFKRSDLPSNSTNGLCWKDLNAKFILLVWRDYLWTQDEGFLKKMYPFLRKAFYWLISTDKNKDYLPDHEGADQTFDLWDFYGASAYGGGIFLASLLALEKMAALLQDEATQKEALLWFKKGSQSFEKKLWYKDYFLTYNNAKEGISQRQMPQYVKSQKVSSSCMAAQLSGQWIAHVLGLGYIVSEQKVKKALATILKTNASRSPFGVVNGVCEDGSIDKTNWQSESVWFGVTYMVASLAIHEGMVKEGLELAKKAWENASVNIRSPWNQADMFSALDGSYLFGDHYMRNMVVWSLLLALGKKNKKIENFMDAVFLGVARQKG